MIIKEQKHRIIPSKPPIKLPERKELPILGTKTKDLITIEMENIAKNKYFEHDANLLRDKRESIGIGDLVLLRCSLYLNQKLIRI